MWISSAAEEEYFQFQAVNPQFDGSIPALRALPYPLIRENLGIAVKKGNARFIRKSNRALRRSRKMGSAENFIKSGSIRSLRRGF